MQLLSFCRTRSVLVVAFVALLAVGAPSAFAGSDARRLRHDVQVTILQTTDLHHHANGADHVGFDVDPAFATSVTGAYSRIASYVNFVRATTWHPVLLVDSGDWTKGTLYDLTLGTRPLALLFMRLMRYDCVTLGNHEFDYGPQGLAQMLGSAQWSFGFHTPIVASNMNINGSPDLAPFVGRGKLIQPTRVQEIAHGLKVGYIGLMGKAAAFTAPVSAPVTFADPATQYAQIQALVNDLRNNRDVNIVVALSHSGTDASGTSGEDVDLARHVTGIDVIASGHTHTPLPGARTVTNGTWTTSIIDAGAYGTNVARIDLTYHASSKTTTVDASSNPAMTNATLTALRPGLKPDLAMSLLVRSFDQQLNGELSGFFSQVFPDYRRFDIASGIYHPVGAVAQDMVSNSTDPLPAPNGLGDLVADAVRSVPNAIIAQVVAAGGNPANLPGYDFTPVQMGVVATGVIRGPLRAGVPLSFSDVYNVLPLGITPDSTQALPVGFPLISGYMELSDIKKVAALQLLVQSGLAGSDNYTNISGIRYSLNADAASTYFKYATAAAVLQVTSQKAAAGSSAAQAALQALSSFASNAGTALIGASGAGNPYALAMVRLNDVNATNLSFAQIATNFRVLGEVAIAAAAGGSTISALIVSKAVAAIDTVSGFGVTDTSNVGSATDLTGTARVRIATDFFAILELAAVQSQFGTTISVYEAPTGSGTLSGADFAGLLQNRLDAAPASPRLQELKEWMALLSYVESLNGFVSTAYASTSNFTQFEGFGLAVTNRNTSYPIAAIAQLTATIAALVAAP